MTMRMNAWDWIAMALVVVGGLNWGLIGLFDVNLVATIFGPLSAVSRIIYTIVGLGAVYIVGSAFAKTGSVSKVAPAK
jgi:hypothetical protein